MMEFMMRWIEESLPKASMDRLDTIFWSLMVLLLVGMIFTKGT